MKEMGLEANPQQRPCFKEGLGEEKDVCFPLKQHSNLHQKRLSMT